MDTNKESKPLIVVVVGNGTKVSHIRELLESHSKVEVISKEVNEGLVRDVSDCFVEPITTPCNPRKEQNYQPWRDYRHSRKYPKFRWLGVLY